MSTPLSVAQRQHCLTPRVYLYDAEIRLKIACLMFSALFRKFTQTDRTSVADSVPRLFAEAEIILLSRQKKKKSPRSGCTHTPNTSVNFPRVLIQWENGRFCVVFQYNVSIQCKLTHLGSWESEEVDNWSTFSLCVPSRYSWFISEFNWLVWLEKCYLVSQWICFMIIC